MITIRLTGSASIPEPWGRHVRTVIIVIVLFVVWVNREALAAMLWL
ncbi:hypothetical protein [Nonomuraea angiospora]|nr:hypothetical protein [Nonomuraea angiospora]MDX3108770.1 hypothetical protein [Nonomuraea angiospora]